MPANRIIALVCMGLLAIALLIFCLFLVEIVTVKGNEIGVKETWSDGVVEQPLQPQTYFLIPGWSQNVFTYDLSSQVFTMSDHQNDPKDKGKHHAPAYLVNSSEGQEMIVSLSVRWHIDPTKIVDLHKTVRGNIEEKLILPSVMLIVKNEATMRKAIEAFSGEGLVKLQNDIQHDLCAKDGELAKRGIVVENFVIEKIKLDDKYIGEIRARQVATQQKLRADEETKAAQALALKAQADAKADYNRRVVEAERDKAVGILKAEENAGKAVLAAKADAERVTVAASADKQRNVLSAEGDKESGLLRAQAIEALGKAEAEATKLKLSAYAVPGADAFVKIEVAKSVAAAYGNIKGFLPGDMKVNLLTESFMKSVDALMGGAKPAMPK